MKKVPDDVKYMFLDEIARSCIQTGPLFLEYKPELQEDQVIRRAFVSILTIFHVFLRIICIVKTAGKQR